jgi:hypothetical protein
MLADGIDFDILKELIDSSLKPVLESEPARKDDEDIGFSPFEKGLLPFSHFNQLVYGVLNPTTNIVSWPVLADAISG